MSRLARRAVTLTVMTWIAISTISARAQTFSTMVPMRDGVELATDVYQPPGEGPWPVVLVRTPYGRESAADLESLTDHGIAVVGQDMRGRYDSEGVDMVFTTDGDGELKDGVDTMAWLVEQSWCDGLIGTYGASALGIVQYMQNSADPPGLVVFNAAVATPNLYTDAMFWGGAFRYSLVVGWLEGQGSLHFLDEVDQHPYIDDFWDSVQTEDQYGNVHAAGIHEGGWYDIFTQGTLDAFVGYQHSGGSGAADAQKLIIGPWTHGGFYGVEQGELTYPHSATSPPYDATFDTMFNHYLDVGVAGIDDTPDDIPAVQYYVMGNVDDSSAPGNEWRTVDDWPPAAAPVRLHLQPGGSLDEACPAADGGVSTFVYDPADPTPTICGGNLNMAAGPCDQREVEGRDDVLVFDTDVLDESLEITGRVRAHVFVDIDQPDTDLMVRMTDVYPDGRSMLIADGACRLAARGTTTGLTPLAGGEVVEAVVDLWSTSIIIDAGHQLRISVTSSNYPRFAANLNNGLDYPDNVEGQGAAVTVHVHHAAGAASYLEVPDPGRDPGDYNDCGPAGDDDTTGDDEGDGGGCDCRTGGGPVPSAMLVLLAVAAACGARTRRGLEVLP